MRIASIIAAVVVAATSLPVVAATSIIVTPILGTAPGAYQACSTVVGGLTNKLCAVGDPIGRDFGTTTNFTAALAVETGGLWLQYNRGAAVDEFSMRNGETHFYSFTPGAGFEIRMLGFDERRITATGGLVPTYDLVDLATNGSIWSRTTGSFDGSRAVEVNSSWSATGLRFSFSNEGSGALGLRNLGFEIRPVDVPPPPPPVGGIPEPASWAMLIAGFGLVGAVSRRRRVSVAA